MYSLRQILIGLRWGMESPNLVLREMNRWYYSQRYGSDYNRTGIDIMQEDWDTLVILDACRYDLFRDENSLPGTLETRISRGSHTSQFLLGNFKGKALHDTVYTTASPQLERRHDEVNVEFHHVENVWDTDRWDNEEGTVLPKDMTDAALEAHEQFPNKRHIVHYMQPHYPFIGSDLDKETRGFDESREEGFDIWNSRMRGRIQIPRAELWSAYQENLKITLDSIKELLETLDGKFVITSDHGNMFGERATPIPIKEWGHPSRIYTKELVKVPWLIYKTNDQRIVRSETPCKSSKNIDMKVTENRLQDLGYI